jgi:beta-apo-4'-carotenal oxygenase
MQKLIESSLDPSSYIIVQGGIPAVQVLLAERWDKIFFTGSANVGRIIAKAAAPHMTPVVLELGGMNPSIISRNANPRLVARRMLWPKVMNAGQICTSQNYLLVEKPILPAVIDEFKKAYKEFYPNGSKNSPDYCRIVNERSFQRIKAMIDNSKGKILMGGTTDEKELFIEPTIVQVDSPQDPMLTEESFGPLIPILPVDSLDEALSISNSVQDTTLGVYAFGTKEENKKGLCVPFT